MTKHWINRAVALLHSSLDPVAHEINELDWKLALSPDRDRIAEHLMAFANLPGGGFLVFGVCNSQALLLGVTREQVAAIVNTVASIGRDALEPPLALEHAVVDVDNTALLFVHIPESRSRPVHRRGRSVEECWVRSGGTTRKASRQETASLMLGSTSPRWEELPPIAFAALDGAFRVTLYAPRNFSEMPKTERIEACYQHATLRYFSGSALTNTSLRLRLKLSEQQRAMTTNLISEAIAASRIKRKDPDSGNKFAEYVPYWA